MAQVAVSPAVAQGRRELAERRFAVAKVTFGASLAMAPADLNAQLGLADAELGLHENLPAEIAYRKVVAAEPTFWVAHKNLVIVEAALDRWEEFDRERAVLRAARERGAEGISTHESDVVDGFTVAGRRWIVREYFEPVGRSNARYNFETFAPDGRVQEYVSLEPEAAAEEALKPEAQVDIGAAGKGNHPPAAKEQTAAFALNWYTGKAHGTIRIYRSGEPTYEAVRAELLHWLSPGRKR